MDLVNIDKLPAMMRELIDLVGYREMLILISLYGGQDIYIPKHPSRSKLAQVLSEHALNQLSYYYGGTYLSLPTQLQIDLQCRNFKILQLLRKGAARATIAKEFGLTTRQVSNIKRLELTSTPGASRCPHK
jgi:DNA-binding NarL/FixJ family response regulator